MTVPRVPEREGADPSLQSTRRRKRSLGVTLIVLGAGATAAIAVAQDGRCREDSPDPPLDCSRGHWIGGHGTGGGQGFVTFGGRHGFGSAGAAHGAGSSGG
jgi:hypothetical protein